MQQESNVTKSNWTPGWPKVMEQRRKLSLQYTFFMALMSVYIFAAQIKI